MIVNLFNNRFYFDHIRHVLVLDNLEERQFFGIPAGVSLNTAHFRIAVKTIAKIHAVGICHKLMLFNTFQQQEVAALSKKTCEDVELDGNFNFSFQLYLVKYNLLFGQIWP